MQRIDTNTILESIMFALKTAYPDIAAVTGEGSIDNSINASDFRVAVTAGKQTEHTAGIKRRLLNFDISYYPEVSAKEQAGIADKLCDVLEFITIQESGVLKGTDIHFEITDGILHFFVSYGYLLYKTDNDSVMETMNLEQEGI